VRLYDSSGVLRNFADPNLEQGWQQAGQQIVLPVTRDRQRLLARVAYFLNPVISSAVEVAQAFVIGDSFTYGAMDDERAQATLEEFWALNGLDVLADRMETEFALDGESLVVWPQDVGDQAAKVVLADVDDLRELQYDPYEGVRRVKLNGHAANDLTFERGEFVWRDGFKSLYNDPRGYSPIYTAIEYANKYLELIAYRMGFHDLASRLMAIYHTVVDMNQPPEKVRRDFKEKSGVFAAIPPGRNILTLARSMDGKVQEDMQFVSTSTRFGDAANDFKVLLRLVGFVLGMPEHFMGEGGGVTRTTAGEMANPVVRVTKRRHSRSRRFLTQVLQTECIRRNGADRLYATIKTRRLPGGDLVRGEAKVPAGMLEFPWIYPNPESMNLEEVTKQVQLGLEQRIMSVQTAQERIGLDPLTEEARLAREGSDGGGGTP
jgi:hypothetical protein